ncbi:MAG: alpha-galactosidase [Prevotellaceae bacterium]|nr:alpha-galactosidase [Prevotellaceae bacterium]
MKKLSVLLIMLLSHFTTFVNAQTFIRISTVRTDLIYKVNENNGRIYQIYLGEKLLDDSEYKSLPGDVYNRAVSSRHEAYSCSGTEDYFEPALAIEHNDGNLTTYLKYVSHIVEKKDDNVTKTVINLKDDVYPVEVKLIFETFAAENIIKSSSEISHSEKKPVKISQYASSMLYFTDAKYFLTEFSGDWAKEVGMSSQELFFGKKIIDTKLGSRAAMFASPFFQLGLGAPVNENEGRTLVGTVAWTGNFRFTFEVDNLGGLRVISGISPYASIYDLEPKTVFKTPEFIFTLSNNGAGQASRDFHSWARNYQLKDGKGDRLTLLNNWEATYFDFNEEKLAGLMKDAKDLGVDMFLLDDGWFGNKYPRSNDNAGLGDWETTKTKLPSGIPFLVKTAKETGVKFGIWIEPEMVNPKSELFEKHPDWVIMQPNRDTYYFRNQLVLDMSNPEVQNFVFGVVDNIMKENPDIAFFKWDCNSPITNIYSPYLKNRQNRLYIDHVRGIYNVFERIADKYPDLPMMLCSGGGGRCDYEALKYFTEFWPSDNTDPIERLYIQWGFSQIFPSKSMCAHVTSWNAGASVKFRTDVAMMCKLGFDIRFNEMKDREKEYCRQAVANYNRLKKTILDGDLFRLVSPYDGNHTAIMYVNESKNGAVLYAFDINPRYSEKILPVKMQGLDPSKKYRIREINLMPEQKSSLNVNDKVLSGDYLMKAGINVFSTNKLRSRVIEITAE